MPTTKELLGMRIREVRRGCNLSQEQLAERVDVDPRYVSRIELGKSSPSLETMEAIANALRVEIRDLFEFGHLKEDARGIEQLEILLQELDEETRRMVIRITRAVTRAVKESV
ncbi:helix-turn-helix domain-containing protein [Geomonas subterranea]|uniref:Helix-turn-helix domain-containing protein n=1 Tax=Geomonas subterranea TaxID=2847989 RepID=A0ABX8LSI1_9BACT|nr:helix-turn-helix transcriptional regulator [Geomonas subterranea]QXE92445.1 helix-turn-helix domain-containing protein [Geomonas subterranea]QXM09456.1 helix-turn-helix domain-containing protein [Geomonas subterranea]